MNEERKAVKIITPVAILSFPHFDEPVQGTDAEGKPQGKPKYSGAFVFESGTDLSEAKAAALEVAEARWPGKVKEMISKSKKSTDAGSNPTFRMPFRTDGKDGYPEDCTFFNARSEQRPQCVYAAADPDTGKPKRVPVSEVRGEFYPGCKVRASVTFFSYDTRGNKGVGVGLNNVQKVGEGERLDSRTAADDEFTVDLSATPASLKSLGIDD